MVAVGGGVGIGPWRPVCRLPAIVAGEVDVIPAERGDGRDEGIIDLPFPAQSVDRALVRCRRR